MAGDVIPADRLRAIRGLWNSSPECPYPWLGDESLLAFRSGAASGSCSQDLTLCALPISDSNTSNNAFPHLPPCPATQCATSCLDCLRSSGRTRDQFMPAPLGQPRHHTLMPSLAQGNRSLNPTTLVRPSSYPNGLKCWN